MKFNIFSLSTALIFSLSSVTFAQSSLRIVDSYSQAADLSIWKGVQGVNLPLVLQKSIKVPNPSMSYEGQYPLSFFQEENYLVCYKDCSNKDSRSDKDSLEQQNVYYWLGQFFKMTRERFDLLPGQRLRVLTSREINDPGTTKNMKNNAFFNSADGSLSFLPASSNPLLSLLGGKLNRSGFDPSVVAHEAAHSLFHSLFPLSINQEIGGINEGFADYLSNILLNDSRVGLVMLRGKALRNSGVFVDSSEKPKVYAPGLEVHSLGERFASAFWIGRSIVNNVDEYDRLIISAIRSLSRNPFATAHGLKEELMARFTYTYDSHSAEKLKVLWDLIIPGSDRRINDTSFTGEKLIPAKFWGLRVSTTFPEGVKEELGIQDDVKRFLFIKSLKTKDGFIANLVALRDDTSVYPYWILIDPERKNSLGAWRLDGSPVNDHGEITKIHSLASQLLVLDQTISDFFKQAASFTDLAQGKGDFSLAYKLTGKTTQAFPLEFNGSRVEGRIHTLQLKRRLLGKLFGIPELESVGIITLGNLSGKSAKLSFDGEAVVGIKLFLKDGTRSETILETISI